MNDDGLRFCIEYLGKGREALEGRQSSAALEAKRFSQQCVHSEYHGRSNCVLCEYDVLAECGHHVRAQLRPINVALYQLCERWCIESV